MNCRHVLLSAHLIYTIHIVCPTILITMNTSNRDLYTQRSINCRIVEKESKDLLEKMDFFSLMKNPNLNSNSCDHLKKEVFEMVSLRSNLLLCDPHSERKHRDICRKERRLLGGF